MTEIIPKENFEIIETKTDYLIETNETVSLEYYNQILILHKLAEKEIEEEITTFGQASFTQNSVSKSNICFNICTVFDNQEKIIAYGISYIDDINSNNYYVDIIYILKEHRGKGLSKIIFSNLVNKIQQNNSIKFVKCITQENNIEAKKLINHFNQI